MANLQPLNLELHHILLDTNFFIDLAKGTKKFEPLLNKFKKNNCILVTIPPVIIEFLRGIEDLNEYKRRIKLLKLLEITSLPLTRDIVNDALEFARLYGREGKNVSVADYLLAATLKKFHRGKMLLLTRDHYAFPLSVFDRAQLEPIEYERGIHLFVLYSFNEKKFEKRLQKSAK